MKLLLIVLTFLFLGCGSAIRPNLAAPKCDEVKAHLLEVGCFNDDRCTSFVKDIVEEKISPRMPKDMEFEPYCDIALMTGVLPVDCVMETSTVGGVLQCVDDWAGSFAQEKQGVSPVPLL